MEERIVDAEITLIPYYPNSDVTLAWYQDPDVCKQVDNIDHVYTLELLNQMYTYLSTHGACYYIRYRGKLVGDVSLRDNGEISIVICKEYQNLHIGRRCIENILALAREKGCTRLRQIFTRSTPKVRTCLHRWAFKRKRRNGFSTDLKRSRPFHMVGMLQKAGCRMAARFVCGTYSSSPSTASASSASSLGTSSARMDSEMRLCS